MKPILALIACSVFFIFAPHTEANREHNRITIEYADLPSPELYARCNKKFNACKGPLCGIDRDYCVGRK